MQCTQKEAEDYTPPQSADMPTNNNAIIKKSEPL